MVYSFFWSTELLGSVWYYKPHEFWRWLLFVFLVVLGGVLAATAGPASAVLMIPRPLDWLVGGGILWLNG